MKTIQNILLNVSTNKVQAYCDNHLCFPEDGEITNKAALINTVNTAFGVSAVSIVVQYTADQYGPFGPKIVINLPQPDPDNPVDAIVVMLDVIEIDYETVNDELVIMKSQMQIFVDK